MVDLACGRACEPTTWPALLPAILVVERGGGTGRLWRKAQGARREACEGRGRTADECEASQRGPGTGPGLGSALGRTRYNQIKS